MYHPGFKQAEGDVQDLLRVFVDFLKAANSLGVAREEANYLWNQIIKNRDILYQDEIRIAVTGDTGTGKSATTNALLGEDLTPEVLLLQIRSEELSLTRIFRVTAARRVRMSLRNFAKRPYQPTSAQYKRKSSSTASSTALMI